LPYGYGGILPQKDTSVYWPGGKGIFSGEELIPAVVYFHNELFLKKSFPRIRFYLDEGQLYKSRPAENNRYYVA
jgi:hypothetical protein